MKQWCALYVSLYPYRRIRVSDILTFCGAVLCREVVYNHKCSKFISLMDMKLLKLGCKKFEHGWLMTCCFWNPYCMFNVSEFYQTIIFLMTKKYIMILKTWIQFQNMKTWIFAQKYIYIYSIWAVRHVHITQTTIHTLTNITFNRSEIDIDFLVFFTKVSMLPQSWIFFRCKLVICSHPWRLVLNRYLQPIASEKC